MDHCLEIAIESPKTGVSLARFGPSLLLNLRPLQMAVIKAYYIFVSIELLSTVWHETLFN